MKNTRLISSLAVILLIALSTLFVSFHSLANRAEDPKATIRINFTTVEQAKEFMSWMSGQGEQDMSIWMSENMPDLDVIPAYDFEGLVIDFSPDQE